MKKKTGFRKALHVLKIGVLSLVSIIIVAGIVTFAVHRVSLKSEESKIVQYGEKIPAFDSHINVVTEGKGEETIVLLTGYGTASPYLDFKPLIAELEKDYRIVTIEPFGYGLSGETTRARTAENMVEEIHHVVKELNIDSFILMGHSIAGIYGLNYVTTYPEEVKGFVGIDSSVPNQPWEDFNDGFLTFVQKSGMLRLIGSLNPKLFENENSDKETNEQIRMITMKNNSNETLRNELKSLHSSFESAKSQHFPENFPLLLFVAKNDALIEGWLDLHQKQSEESKLGKMIELPGGHYLHHTQSSRIAKEVKAYFAI